MWSMARRAAFLALVTLSCTRGFVLPVPRTCFSSRTRARDTSAVHLLPGGSGEIIAGNLDIGAAAIIPDTSAFLVVNADAAHAGGGISAASLLATAAPGNSYLATGLFGFAAAAIAAGAGFLVLSAVQGKNGLGVFLSQEKGTNPFYKDTISKFTPKTPDILNKIRLPDLDFVEVYNQPTSPDDFLDDEADFESVIGDGPQDPITIATAESLRQKLLMAVQTKDYELASSLERELASFLRKNGINFEGDGK